MIMKFIKMTGVVAVFAFVSTALADYTLTDHNSTAVINPSAQTGMYNWTVDGVDQLNQQWFWYRVGTTGGQSSIDTISAPTITTPAANIITMSYQNASFQVNLSYTLTGGSAGSGFSDISESISIFNKSTTTPLDFHFFQYSDFDLGGTSAGDVGQYLGTGKVTQYDTTSPSMLSETVSSRLPNHYQVALFPTIKTGLNGGTPFTLSDTPAVNSSVGPGDVTWGFEWDLTIAANGSVVWSKDKTISKNGVPDSGTTIMLLGAALSGLALLRRRLAK
jgi:hypothetical protein